MGQSGEDVYRKDEASSPLGEASGPRKMAREERENCRVFISHLGPEGEGRAVKNGGDASSGERGCTQEGEPSRDAADVQGAIAEFLSAKAQTAPARTGVFAGDQLPPHGSRSLHQTAQPVSPSRPLRITTPTTANDASRSPQPPPTDTTPSNKDAPAGGLPAALEIMRMKNSASHTKNHPNPPKTTPKGQQDADAKTSIDPDPCEE